MATLADLVVNLRADTAKFRRDMGLAERTTSDMTRSVLRLGAVLGGGFGLTKAGQFIINTNREFERLNAQLITVTGSQESASAAFRELERFASTTPFQIEENVQAFIRLRALGIQPTNDLLTDFGNIASGMGRRITDFASAVQGAVTGETEALKSFGIVSRVAGDQMSFTFQGVTRTVNRSADEIVAALREISQSNFAGAMANEMNTLNGIISVFQDNLGIAARAIGVELMPVVRQFGAELRDIVGGDEFREQAVHGVGFVLEKFGQAINFVSSHPLSAEFGLLGLVVFGKRGAAGLAILGAAIDEVIEHVTGPLPELQRREREFSALAAQLEELGSLRDAIRLGNIERPDLSNVFASLGIPDLPAINIELGIDADPTQAALTALDQRIRTVSAQALQAGRDFSTFAAIMEEGRGVGDRLGDALERAGRQMRDFTSNSAAETGAFAQHFRNLFEQIASAQNAISAVPTTLPFTVEFDSDVAARVERWFEEQQAIAEQNRIKLKVDVTPFANGQEKILSHAKEVSDDYQVIWDQALRNVQDSFARTFSDIFDNGVRSITDLADRVLQVMKDLAAQLLAAKLFEGITTLLPSASTKGGSTAGRGGTLDFSPGASAVSVPDIAVEIPRVPEVQFGEPPRIQPPSMPALMAPSIEPPQIPGLTAPEIPNLEAPQIPAIVAPEIPGLTAPELPVLRAPDLPPIEIVAPRDVVAEFGEPPTLRFPKMPDLSMPDIPEISIPEIPGLQPPDLPTLGFDKLPELLAPEVRAILKAPETIELATTTPDLPSLTMNVPGMPDLAVGDIPSLLPPELPEIKAPDFPALSVERLKDLRMHLLPPELPEIKAPDFPTLGIEKLKDLRLLPPEIPSLQSPDLPDLRVEQLKELRAQLLPPEIPDIRAPDLGRLEVATSPAARTVVERPAAEQHVHVHFTVNAIDAPGVQRFIEDNRGLIASEVARARIDAGMRP